MPSNMATSASSWQRRRAQRADGQAERAATAGSGGARDCSGNWSERSERRLERKARSRSDAPGLTVPFRKPASVIGTIDCITVWTIVVGSNGRIDVTAIAIIAAGIIAAGIIATSITGSITAAAATTSASIVAGSLSCCGGRAAEPPRSAALAKRRATRRRAARRWRRRGVRPKRGERAAPVSDAARDALRPMRCSAGPGCRAAARGRRGCR